MAYPSCLRPSTLGFRKSSIVGGWAHRLFRYHPLAQAVQYEPLLTLDTDVALPVRLEVREQDLRDRLASAGFKERFLGEHQPPATRYRLGDEEGSFYVEFLTPLIGSEHDRDGNLRTIGGSDALVQRTFCTCTTRLNYLALRLMCSEKTGSERQNRSFLRAQF